MTSTVPPLQDLTVDQLGPLGALLGAGGQAKVYELPALSLPDVSGPLVYKQYKPGRAPAHGMSKIIALRTRLLTEPAKVTRLDASTTWPVRQVVDANGALAGLVLRRIPDSFMHDVRLPSGKVSKSPREVQFLFIPPDRALRGGTPTPTPTERLTICRDFAATLAFLHGELNVAFGDVNARNAVFRLGEEPTVMFVDCDAVRVVGEMAVAPQLNAPDWDPPEGSDVLSRVTDRYKLGLFVLRCLTPDRNSSINRDPNEARGVLDVHGLKLLTAAIRGTPAERPSAEEWHRYLRRALGETLAPPRLDRVELDRTIVAAGEPLTVSWSAEEADAVVVSGGGVPDTTVPGIAGSGTIVLHPVRTGRFTVTARNQLGEDRARTEPVAVFDMPSFQDLPVPLPQLELPRLTPMDLPPVGRVLPRFPTGTPVPVPPMANVVDAWGAPDTRPAPEKVAIAGPPPLFGFGESAIPFDLTETIADPGADQKVRP
jgi:hypothetical protein